MNYMLINFSGDKNYPQKGWIKLSYSSNMSWYMKVSDIIEGLCMESFIIMVME